MCVLLIDLDVQERCNLVRLLRRSLAARLGVRDRAEARAVGERDKAVQVFWADGDFCSRLGLGHANRGAPARGKRHPITQKILASLILCFDEQLDWSVDDIPAELLEVRPLLDDVPPDIVDRLQGVLDRSSLPLRG